MELTIHKKKKMKKHSAVELPAANNEYQTCEEMNYPKKHRKKKITVKGKENYGSPAKVRGDMREGRVKKKRKHEREKVHLISEVLGEVDSRPSCQGREVMKKRKKMRRTEQRDQTVVNTESEMTSTPVETNYEASHKSVKRKCKMERKCRKAHTSAATGAQITIQGRTKGSLELDKEALFQEMQEYLPGHRNALHNWDLLKSIVKYDLPRFREFKRQGIPIRTGRFTVAETNRLKQNIKDFLALSGLQSEIQLLMPHRFPEKKMILKLRKNLGFLKCLCAGIPRSFIPILDKAKDMYDPENHLGRFAEKEDKDLKSLQKVHGNNWKAISEKMGRSNKALRKRFKLLHGNHGPWTEQECRALQTSVRQQLLKRATPAEDGSIGSAVIRKVDLYKRLSWSTVANRVQTRNSILCRNKWFGYLTNKMRIGGVIKGRKSLEGQIQLIKAINDMAVEDMYDIVWDDLTHLFGNTHPDYLRLTFYKLKVAHVPGWNRMMDFCEVIDYLYEKTLPKLEEELRNCKEDEEATEERETYKLSEIFPDL